MKCTFVVLVALAVSVVLVELLTFSVPERDKISSNYSFFIYLYSLCA